MRTTHRSSCPRPATAHPRLRAFLSGLLAALVLVAPAGRLSAREAPPQEASSLALVPQDVAFYSATLRAREQLETLLGSNAVKRIKEVPTVQFLLAMARQQWEGAENPQLQQFRDWLEEEENQQLIALLGDMWSHEVFFVGGAGWADTFEVLIAVNRHMRVPPLEVETGEKGRVILERMLKVVRENRDKLKVPATLIGFRLTDAERAQAQLRRLEELAGAMLAEQPGLADRFERKRIAGADFLILSLDGSLIPWDEVREEIDEEDRELAEELIKIGSEMKLTISLGVRDKYLLLSLGENNDQLAALGRGPSLWDHEDFAPLREAPAGRLASVGYVSGTFLRQVSNVSQQLDSLRAMAEVLLPQAELDPQLEKDILADVRAFIKDIEKLVPRQGSLMAFTHLTPRGYDGYQYSKAEQKMLEGSLPLTLLDHLGGRPLAFYAARGRYAPEHYALTQKWCGRIWHYLRRPEVWAKVDADERAEVEKFLDGLEPLLKRIDKITGGKLMPSLKDGQSALVLDARITSRQWHQAMPPAEEPLPMLELGLVWGVSDPALLKEAMGAYMAVARDAVDLLKGMAEEFPQDFEIPSPQTRETEAGTLSSYALPEEWGLDPRLAPTAGVSDKVAAAGLSEDHVLRLLKRQPLELKGPLATRDRPLAAAAYFNWEGLVNAVSPWIDYGMGVLGGGAGDDPAEGGADPEAAMVKQMSKLVQDLLKCFKGYSSVTWLEEGATVTHFEWHFEDVK